jgi:uncharacterized membrane protein YtjA (UPF0391 family)
MHRANDPYRPEFDANEGIRALAPFLRPIPHATSPGFARQAVRRNYQLPKTMLHWTLVFLVVALIAALLGFGGIAGSAVGIAKILFFVFLVLWLLSFLFRRGNAP